MKKSKKNTEAYSNSTTVMSHRKKLSVLSRGSHYTRSGSHAAHGLQHTSSEDLQSPPFNAAMEALRRMRPPAKGATPVTDPDSAFPFGHHVHSMLLACWGALGAGTALGFASPAMASIEHQPWYNVTPNTPPHNRWIADSLFLGATTGAILSGLLLHLVGYRRILLLSSCGLAGLWVFLGVSSSVSLMIVGRVASGMCLGVFTNCACLYVADICPPAKRAFYGSLVEMSTSAGVLVAYLLGGLAWQLQAGGCALASMPVLALHKYAIENPRWLQMRGRELDADTALMRLYGVDPPPDFRPQHLKGAPPAQPDPAKLHWPRQARLVVACLLLQLLQNLSCAQLCLLRAVQVVGAAVADIPAQTAAALVVTLHVGFTALFAAVTNIAGRSRLLGTSAGLVAGTLLIFRPLEYLYFKYFMSKHLLRSQWSVDEQPLVTSWAAVLSVTLLVLAYSVGLCHLPALLTGELLPAKLRHPTSSFIWASRWLVAFVFLHFDTEVLNTFSQRASLLALSIMVLLIAANAVLLIPETEGRTLGDIQSG